MQARPGECESEREDARMAHGESTTTDVLEMLEAVASKAGEEQKRVLLEILTLNARTEYLRGLGIGCSSCREDPASDLQTSFKLVAPIVTYDDIEPLIKRIANGDQSPILAAQPFSLFVLSSGTSSSEPKLIPSYDDELHRTNNVASRLPFELLGRALQEAGVNVEANATKMLNFLFVKPQFRTPGNFPVRTAITNVCRSEAFRNHAPSAFISPIEVLLCEDMLQTMYCHLLCGLIQRSEVGSLGAIFAAGFLRVMHFLEERWEELVRDIHGGTLSNQVVTDPAARRGVEALIATAGGPNPALAEEIEAECKRHPNWQGIIRRLWPQARYIWTVVTGSMAQYVSMLEFYTQGLPFVSSSYACSEGYFGVNLDPLCPPAGVSYMMLPNMAYFEFLPCPATDESQHTHPTSTQHSQRQAACTGSPAPSLVDLVDVKLGTEYELVVTTYSGLYRYRMGDVFRVTGFYKRAPLFRIVRRTNVLLSVDTEKTNEETLQRAVEAAASAHLQPAGWRLVDYTSYADVSTSPGHYVLFWEVSRVAAVPEKNASVRLEPATMQACCLAMEENLGLAYRWLRMWEKSIAPLEIRVVQGGTFTAIMEMVCGQVRGSSISQYKVRRCVNKEVHGAILDLLNSHVSISAFGPRHPSFTFSFH